MDMTPTGRPMSQHSRHLHFERRQAKNLAGCPMMIYYVGFVRSLFSGAVPELSHPRSRLPLIAFSAP